MENSRADTLGVGGETRRRWELKGIDNRGDKIEAGSEHWARFVMRARRAWSWRHDAWDECAMDRCRYRCWPSWKEPSETGVSTCGARGGRQRVDEPMLMPKVVTASWGGATEIMRPIECRGGHPGSWRGHQRRAEQNSDSRQGRRGWNTPGGQTAAAVNPEQKCLQRSCTQDYCLYTLY